MNWRLGPGPLFWYEWLLTARRWQLFALRSTVVACLLLTLAIVWGLFPTVRYTSSRTGLAVLGEVIFYGVASTLIVMTMLAGPAYTAGSICTDKVRGTLVALFATDLSAVEIVIGKLGARLIAVLSLVACSAPVLSACMFLGGIYPEAVIGTYAVVAGVAVLGSTLSLFLSIWMQKPFEALLLTYLVWMFLSLAGPLVGIMGLDFLPRRLPPFLDYLNPFNLAFGPYLHPEEFALRRPFYFLAGACGLSLLLVLIAMIRIRAVVLRQSNRGAARVGRRSGILTVRLRLLKSVFGPSLDRNPVLWREWHRRRLSRGALLVWFLYGLVGVVATFQVAIDALQGLRGFSSVRPELLQAGIVFIGLLLYVCSATTAWSDERDRSCLDALLSTPLTSRTIALGKWLGAMRMLPAVLVFPAMISFLVASEHDAFLPFFLSMAMLLANCAAFTSLGLLLAGYCSRLGSAMAVSVIIYLLVSFAVPFLGLFSTAGNMAAIFFASPWLTASILMRWRDESTEYVVIYCVWFATHVVAAVVLFQIAASTLNAHLGRSTLCGTVPRRRLPDLKGT